jgi:hypothetical protein
VRKSALLLQAKDKKISKEEKITTQMLNIISRSPYHRSHLVYSINVAAN